MGHVVSERSHECWCWPIYRGSIKKGDGMFIGCWLAARRQSVLTPFVTWLEAITEGWLAGHARGLFIEGSLVHWPLLWMVQSAAMSFVWGVVWGLQRVLSKFNFMTWFIYDGRWKGGSWEFIGCCSNIAVLSCHELVTWPMLVHMISGYGERGWGSIGWWRDKGVWCSLAC